ncbi:MAG: hypothetical protein HY074_19655, partial [Deltaproteobacteria bacterium]|nr:hypothetical protein [Deltaproteobacteria bacterium]
MMSLALTSCGGGGGGGSGGGGGLSGGGPGGGPAPAPINPLLAISPASLLLVVNNVFSFSASGGFPTYSYSLVSGGGNIDSRTGRYSAPASPGSAVVRVFDSTGSSSDATVTINPVLAISPSSTSLSINTSTNFTATGGVPPYSYSVFTGGGTINAANGRYAAPSAPGTATVRVTDVLGNTSDSAVTINPVLTISPSSKTLVVTTSFTFTATYGTSPYVFSIFSGGGTINGATGVYNAPGATGSATIRVTDSVGAVSDAAVTINPPLAISPGTKTLSVNNTFTFTGTGGVPAYSYSVFAGGGSVNSTNGVYTAPASAGTATLRVTDSAG